MEHVQKGEHGQQKGPSSIIFIRYSEVDKEQEGRREGG
jgi:hypothetical protein